MIKKITFGLIFIGAIFISFKFIDKVKTKNSAKILVLNDASENRLQVQIKEVKKVIDANSKCNNEIAFFIDMKIPSGKNRFFVYDLKKEAIVDQGLVAHGSGSETGIQGKLKFSNTNNSLATSLGKYYIGSSYVGKFGKAYRLYGLDKTNSNAFDRAIVLHKYFDVPYEEQADYICNSYGCPMVNEKYFKRIESIIDNSKTNILLVIYY
ncbi:MAG: murein L,D-transpeptidase catalytic domain family protein [Bacteroidota bacterium]